MTSFFRLRGRSFLPLTTSLGQVASLFGHCSLSEITLIPPSSPFFRGIPTTVNLSFAGLELNLHRGTLVRLLKFFESIDFKALEELERRLLEIELIEHKKVDSSVATKVDRQCNDILTLLVGSQDGKCCPFFK